MPVLTADAATTHDVHGARFTSFARPQTGSTQLCTWRLDVAAGTPGLPHRPSREEVLVVAVGTALVTIDGEQSTARPGDVVLVPAGSILQLDVPGPEPLSAWVTTGVGLTARLPDGSTLTPPWTL